MPHRAHTHTHHHHYVTPHTYPHSPPSLCHTTHIPILTIMSHHMHTHTRHHHYVIPHTYLHRYVAACFQCLGNGQCRTVGPAAVRDCHHCRCALLGTADTGTGAGNTKQARVMTHSTQSIPGAQLTASNTKQASVITHSIQSFHGAQRTASNTKQASIITQSIQSIHGA